MKNKIMVVGCGNVGMAYVYALLNQKNKVDEIALVDLDRERIEGEVMDLNHALVLSEHSTSVKVGSYADAKDAKICCITASRIAQVKTTSRMDELAENKSLFQEIVGNVMNHGFQGIFLIASNPVDIMAGITQAIAKVDPSRVIGTGTALDTARLQYILSKNLKVDPQSIDAYVLGEHGPNAFVLWSGAHLGTVSLNSLYDQEAKKTIERMVIQAGYDIVRRKKATYYGVAMTLVAITNAILEDKKQMMIVSNYDEQNEVYIGSPVILGKTGIEKRLPFALTDLEKTAYLKAVTAIHQGTKNDSIHVSTTYETIE